MKSGYNSPTKMGTKKQISLNLNTTQLFSEGFKQNPYQ